MIQITLKFESQCENTKIRYKPFNKEDMNSISKP